MKTFLLSFIALFTLPLLAQVKIQGTVLDAQKKPISDVTTFLSLAKDSTLVSYTNTNEQGFFELQVKPITDSVHIQLSLMGYEDQKLTYPNLTESINLGTLTLKEDSSLLSEIVIVTDAPVRVKNDTLEFNAASFKVRPDANVEALLKKLPGVEIDADKNITVNGKKVSQILVNNKPFFNKDGSIALQNLPAELIKKVQVTEAKTKSEEFTGRKALSDNASINLTIDEDKNKGLMGKIMAGLGTDERYESSGLLNYFKGDRKISVLASSNNINSSGFSMDDIFDNMGGGRSQFFSFAGRNGFLGGGNNGITRSHLVGFNYSDTFFDTLESNMSYNFSNRNNENNNRSHIFNLLPNDEFITDAESKNISDSDIHNVNMEFEYEIDKNTRIYIEPSIEKTRSTFDNLNRSIATDLEGNKLNESNGTSHSTADAFNFSNSFLLNKKWGKNNHNISVSFDNKNARTEGLGRSESQTFFYKGTDPDDYRNQQEVSRSTNDSYKFNIEYTQPISKDLSLSTGYSFENNQQTDVLSSYNFDTETQAFHQLNDRLSNETVTKVSTNTPYASVRYYVQQKVFFTAQSGINLSNYQAKAHYMGQTYETNKKFISPYISASLQYSLTKSKTFNLFYNYAFNNPSANQILDYELLNDPLNTWRGNANIDQGKSHYVSMGFRDFNFQTRSGWSVNLRSDYFESKIVSATFYDENKKRTTTFANIHDAYTINFNARWNQSKKWNEHSFRYNIGLSSSYGLNKEITNDVLNDATSYAITPSVNLSWDYGDLLSISPSYRFNYNKTDYDRLNRPSADYITQNFMLQTTTYWPENWAWGNDFSYTYNSKMSGAFRPDFFLWNTSLSYTFLNKSLTAKVKVYDILNQNTGTSRVINATNITDQENTVLRRYAMFSLAYKFDKFGTSKESDRKRGGNRNRIIFR